MEPLRLVRPGPEHQCQYESMMEEWEQYGGRLNPGALRRYSRLRQKTVPYGEWLAWIVEDRTARQDLYFLMSGDSILGAVSIRYQCDPVDGHVGFGIWPSQRGRGYGTKLLALALPILNRYGIDPAAVSCAKENAASARVIVRNGGIFVREVVDEGETVQIYHIRTGQTCAHET